jgi:hypothetical protein
MEVVVFDFWRRALQPPPIKGNGKYGLTETVALLASVNQLK